MADTMPSNVLSVVPAILRTHREKKREIISSIRKFMIMAGKGQRDRYMKHLGPLAGEFCPNNCQTSNLFESTFVPEVFVNGQIV